MKIADFTVANTHVPSDPNAENPQVCWKVVLSHKGTPLGVFDYSTGIGHIPGYTTHLGGRETIKDRGDRRERVRIACTRGQSVRRVGDSGMCFGHVPLTGPTPADFVYCLASDASCWLSSDNVEDFAAEFGHDDQGYLGARNADEAFAACGVAFKAFAQCGADADAIAELMEECDV